MKYISNLESANQFYLICNRAEREKEGMYTLERLQLTVSTFLNKDIHLLGVLLEDSHVRKAVKLQVPLYHAFPNSSIAVRLEKMVEQYLGDTQDSSFQTDTSNRFIRKFRNFFIERQGR